MKYRVIVVPKAQSDLDCIVAWIAKKSVAGAARLLDQFHRELTLIAENPLRYGLAPETEILGLDIRQTFFKTRRGLTYRALFDIDADCVRILRIRGPGQDLVKG